MIHRLFFLLLAGFFSIPASAAPNAESRLDRILSSGKLRACIWPDYYGISYRNPKTQQLSGIDVDLVTVLAGNLGVRLELVDSSFSRLFADIAEDRCDLASFAIGITPQRLEKLRFTRPHLASDIYAVTTRSHRRVQSWADIDRPGSVVAVARGTLHEHVMKEMLKSATLKVLDTPHAREQEVESGRADVFMTDYPYSRRMLATTDWARVIAPEGRYRVTPYAWAMQPGDDRWHARVERFISEIRQDGRLAAAARRHQLEPILVVE